MTEIKFVNDVVVELIKTNATDIDVARSAWVSTLGEEAREGGDPNRVPGLINYLMRDKHGTPFENAGSFTFFVKCPLFVAREFMRHRVGWSYNEESGRYSKLNPEFYMIDANRKITQKGKPGHYQFYRGSNEQYAITMSNINNVSQRAWDAYEQMLDYGVAKEVARMVLPLNIMTSLYATCNARSLMSFLSLRTEHEDATFPSHPQWEIQLVANKMEGFFAEAMPITYESFVKNGRVSP